MRGWTVCWSGFEVTAQFAPPSVLPDTSPSRGEIGSFSAGSFPKEPVTGEIADEGAISPPEGEMSGRTEGGGTAATQPPG